MRLIYIKLFIFNQNLLLNIIQSKIKLNSLSKQNALYYYKTPKNNSKNFIINYLIHKMNIHGFDNMPPRAPNDSNNNISMRRQDNQQNMNIFDSLDPLTVENIKNAEKYKVLFVSGNRRIKNPKEENYFDMLKDLCCPTFHCISFTSVVLVVTLVMYIVELSLGLNKAG
jgi:hypothetical protein